MMIRFIIVIIFATQEKQRHLGQWRLFLCHKKDSNSIMDADYCCIAKKKIHTMGHFSHSFSNQSKIQLTQVKDHLVLFTNIGTNVWPTAFRKSTSARFNIYCTWILVLRGCSLARQWWPVANVLLVNRQLVTCTQKKSHFPWWKYRLMHHVKCTEKLYALRKVTTFYQYRSIRHLIRWMC